MRDKTSPVLFVDRGGTATKVWVGKKVSRFPSELTQLSKALRRYLRKHNLKPSQAYFGSRGVWTPAEKKALHKKFSFLAKRVKTMSDIELGHVLAFGRNEGIVLNAGTGSIAYGRNRRGKTARSGGMGPLLGDEGSAFWIGRESLKHKPTRAMAKSPDAVKRIAALAMRVLQSRNTEAKRIQNEAHTHLIRLIDDVRKKLGIKKPAFVSLRGGLFQNKNFRTAFLKKARGYKPVA